MTWQRYITEAERKYRPESMRALYCYRLDFTIKGVTFTRWFRSALDREHYVNLDLPNSILARLIDNAGETT